jgi:hypothetical protein
MSAYQEERELAEALRVQAMSPQERSQWLRATWGPLQAQAASLYSYWKPAGEPRAMHFATLDAKNRFDEQREIEQAVRLAISRRHP